MYIRLHLSVYVLRGLHELSYEIVEGGGKGSLEEEEVGRNAVQLELEVRLLKPRVRSSSRLRRHTYST